MAKIDLYNDDCLNILHSMSDNSIQLMVTSPPYFNAREYSQYVDLDEYKSIMKTIFTEVYRVLENHRYIVVNVGDILAQVGHQKSVRRRLALGAYFTIMLQEIGFIFIDDYIWDKGEPQSKRNVGNPPYPLYNYPINCYEHILIMAKHEEDKQKINCPICNSDKVVNNGFTSIGVFSFECKNPECAIKSNKGRGKRFSALTVMRDKYKTDNNKIDEELLKLFRRDIVKINPVIKINNKKENLYKHSAPYPLEIPNMAIQFFTGENDTVMDCFMGSGTTGVICKKYNRNFIGVELNQEYFEVAKNRIETEEI